MGERWFRPEYLCEFEDTVSGIFAGPGGGGDYGRDRAAGDR